VGKEVLDIIDDEGLVENARLMGDALLSGLQKLQDKHEVIGDVRGCGLFIGLDLVTDRTARTPGTKIADYVKNRLREHRILIGTEGPFNNILKIRPPLTIEADDIEMILTTLDRILDETVCLTAGSG
jgi:4-aminobutyrate aminotransferase-like enzyme